MANAGATRAVRKATVLEPSFVEELSDLSTDEVRRRRDQAFAEREFQSYLRRLIQTRQDLLVAERKHRRGGQEAQPLVDRLTAALSKGPKAGPGRGEAVRYTLTHDDLEQADREADAMIEASRLSDPSRLSDDELEAALAALAEGEKSISSDRTAVLRVHDLLQEELKRRYSRDPSQIPQGI